MTRVQPMTDAIKPPSKRDQLIEAAWNLSYRDGYHATGIDRILAESSVAKMTLYHHFRSKEELILAVLEKRGRETLESLRQFLDAKNRSPEKRLEAVFDWLVAWIESKEFRGCAFLKAMAEYQNLDDPIHQAALAHKAALTAEITHLVAVAGLKKLKNLPEQLSLLTEGAIVQSHAIGNATPAFRAREAAKTLIAASRRKRIADSDQNRKRNRLRFQ
jgi:AcrR family transcriptional regulator